MECLSCIRMHSFPIKAEIRNAIVHAIQRNSNFADRHRHASDRVTANSAILQAIEYKTLYRALESFYHNLRFNLFLPVPHGIISHLALWIDAIELPS